MLHYSCFSSHITAFSTERGRVTDVGAAYDGFNINPYCGDDEAHIASCRRELCLALGIDNRCLILPHQTHGTRVACLERGDSLEGVDAIMTAHRGVCIGVSTADCIPILLHDTRHDVICAVHSGWRGTVAHITAHALAAMVNTYGTNIADVVAAIGPGIRVDAFEVGDEVYDVFCVAGFDMSTVARRVEAKWHIDLIAAIQSDLNGVHTLYDCGICTHTSVHRFFSARRLGVHSGRIYSGIMLKQ